MACFRLFSSFFLPFLLCFPLGLRFEVTDPSPSPPLFSPSFPSTSFPSDRVLSTHLSFSGERRDRLRLWMFGEHQVWGLLPVCPSITPTFGVDSLKLFVKSPYHTRIAWHLLPCQTRFDLVVSLAGITAPNLLLLRTLIVVGALVLLWTVDKICVDLCLSCCVVCVCCSCCCCSKVVVVVVSLFCFSALLVGCFVVTNVTFASLYVGFRLPLCRVCNMYYVFI